MPKEIHWTPPDVPFVLANVEPLGVTHEVLSRAVAQGRICRLGHGVYLARSAMAEDPAGQVLQRAVAFQMRRAGAIASHTTAALAWELPLPDTAEAIAGPLRFTMTPRKGRRSEVGAGHRIVLRALPAEHRSQHPGGLFLTTAARTAVDLAVGLPLPEALIALDGATRQDLVLRVGQSRLRDAYTKPTVLAATRQPLLDCVPAAATAYGQQALRTVVALADPRRESALESRSYGHILLAGLPLPELQIAIDTPDGVFYPDFLWPAARLIGEADGMDKLQSSQDMQHLYEREQFLRRECGYSFVRWSYDEMLRRPASVIARIGAGL